MPSIHMKYLLFVSVALCTAMIVNHYIFLNVGGWLILAVFLLGVLVCWCALPARGYQAFSQELLPLLNAIEDYLFSIKHRLFSAKEMNVLDQKKEIIIQILQSTTCCPEWVFNFGFNPGLRAGYRFFLIKIELLTEILFSLHHLFKRVVNIPRFASLHDIIFLAITRNEELLEVIIGVFAKRALKETASDYVADIEQLEKNVLSMLPHHVELLAMSPDEEYLAAFSRLIKDLRKVLLELVAALP